jgi:hypothetical protein
VVKLGDKLEELGRSLGEREAAHRGDLEEAWRKAQQLHEVVTTGIGRFVASAEAAGAPRLEIVIGEPRTDDKHIRAVEFELRRGRHAAIVTAKSKGEVTLVGPFHIGKVEGPCRSFPFSAAAELDVALSEFLVGFLEEAMSP